MKKIFYIAAAGVCALFVSCSQKSDSTVQTEATDTVTVAQEQQDAASALGEVLQLSADDTLAPADKPIVVDFWATWCGPCMQFKPVYHDAAVKYSSKAIFAAVDIDQCKALAEKYNISSIPTVLILMPDGTTRQQTGYMDAAQFADFLGDIAK